MPAASRVLMLGEPPEVHGAAASSVRAYRASGLFERWPVRHVPLRTGSMKLALATLADIAAHVAFALIDRGGTVVHLHAASRAGFWAQSIVIALAACAGCPVILQLHGDALEQWTESGDAGLHTELRLAVLRFFLDRCHCVVVPTERLRRWVRSVSAYTASVCIPDPVLATIPASGRRRMILFAGAHRPGSGLGELLQAVSGLRLQSPDITLACTGPGDPQAARVVAERLGITDAVAFLDCPGEATAHEEQLRALRQRAAVFVVPAPAVGIPSELLAAMAARLPIIACRTRDVSELITDGVDGLLFAPGDTAALHRLLCRVLHDPGLAIRLGAAARRSVMRRHSADRAMARLGSIYAGLAVQPLAVRPCVLASQSGKPA